MENVFIFMYKHRFEIKLGLIKIKTKLFLGLYRKLCKSDENREDRNQNHGL